MLPVLRAVSKNQVSSCCPLLNFQHTPKESPVSFPYCQEVHMDSRKLFSCTSGAIWLGGGGLHTFLGEPSCTRPFCSLSPGTLVTVVSQQLLKSYSSQWILFALKDCLIISVCINLHLNKTIAFFGRKKAQILLFQLLQALS